MKSFFWFSCIYLAFSAVVTALTRPVDVETLAAAVDNTATFGRIVVVLTLLLLPALAVLILTTGRRSWRQRMFACCYALIGSVLLHTGFAFVKSSIPLVVPFYADPALASFDKWLHGGTDPWVITHDWFRTFPITEYLSHYLTLWLPPAMLFLLFIAACDDDRERVARFVVLYCVAWVVIGNVFAFAGSSVGPVYYDALLGGDRFGGLIASLTEMGSFETKLGLTQQALWRLYEEHRLLPGLGISAFPSVHVSVANVVALYLLERSRILAIPGFAFLAATLFLSVYTGYHYALDGYFSILIVTGLWYVLRKRRLTEMTFSLSRLGMLARLPGPGAAMRQSGAERP